MVAWAMAQVAGMAVILAGTADPVLPPGVSQSDVARLRRATAALLALPEARVRELVPTQSGLMFTGCPNCRGGRQEGQLAWSLGRPEVVVCRYCQHAYPSDKYPMREVDTRRGPSGKPSRYPYWANAQGYRHYFAACLDYHKARFLEDQALYLAQLAYLTHEEQPARYAAVLLDRFAEVYPDWCYKYDYPFQQKVIEDGDVKPERFRNGFRTSRWHWWAYMDIPGHLVRAFDLLRAAGALARLSTERGYDVAQRVLAQLFRPAAEQVLANREDLTNMSPFAWRDAILLGRVVSEPRYVHEPLRRLALMLERQFYYDGCWMEGAPSYQSQTNGGIRLVRDAAHGYSDPPEWQPPAGERRLTNLDLDRDLAKLGLSEAAYARLHLPDGREVPVHDTWSTSRGSALKRSPSYLLGGLGHACLGRGEGANQEQAHLTWSGGYGHEHADGLSLLLHSGGHELLSDLGYSHTAWRAWTVTSLAHNVVVVDEKAQATRGGGHGADGTLRWIALSDDGLQGLSVDNANVYPGVCQRYRRTLLQVPIDAERSYLVDRFEVDGGQRHDYLLWGSADAPQELRLTGGPGTPVATLLPDGLTFRPPANEGDSAIHSQPGLAYGFLGRIRAVTGVTDQQAEFSTAGGGVGLRVVLCTQPGETVYAVEGPSIRGAKEADPELPKHQRAGLLWRRDATSSRFLSVIEPHRGQPGLQAHRLSWPGVEDAVEVRLADGRRDVVLFGAREAKGSGDGPAQSATGEAVVWRWQGARCEQIWLAGAGEVSAGALRAQCPPPAEHRVVAFEERALRVEPPLAVQPGEVVLVEHGDGAVSPYTVRQTAGAGRIDLVETSGYQLTPEGEAKAVCHPFRNHRGPHRARVTPVARSMARN